MPKRTAPLISTVADLCSRAISAGLITGKCLVKRCVFLVGSKVSLKKIHVKIHWDHCLRWSISCWKMVLVCQVGWEGFIVNSANLLYVC